MTEFEPLSVSYTAGWVGRGESGLFGAEGASLMLPDVSQELLGREAAQTARAEAEAAAAREDRQANQAQIARMAGYSATSVEDVLARVRTETAAADRRAERHRALEQP